MLWRYTLVNYGTPTPTLFHCRGRGGQPHGGSRKATFRRTAFAEPPDSRSRTGTGHRPSHSRSPRSGAHGGGPSVSGSCADRAAASRSGRGGGPPRRAATESLVRHRISDRLRNGVAAGVNVDSL